jgi:protein-L-isoaspartate O-methyltransferase
MPAAQISGTEGYARDADALIERYERISAAEAHQSVLHLIPKTSSRILDIGAGTGRDAAWLAENGHRVVAVEPTDELRVAAQRLHPAPGIKWLDDSLPDLSVLRSRGEEFDVIMLTAVFMHLDEQQRRRAMTNLAALMHEEGVMIMSLRHGPVPAGRRMFAVSAEETIELAQAHGLRPVLNFRSDSSEEINRLAGVTWTRLAFVKRSAARRFAPY